MKKRKKVLQVAKKQNKIVSSIMLVLVSVFLVFVVSTSFTLAWFASQDAATGQFSFGGAVVVQVANQDGELADSDPVTISYSADSLLPGIKILPDIQVLLLQSSTASVMRARIDTSVEGLSAAQNEQLNSWFVNSFMPQVNDEWDMHTDGWFYYLGLATSSTMVMTQTATDSGLTSAIYGSTYANYTAATNRSLAGDTTVLGSIAANSHNESIAFLTHSFRLPYNIDDSFANATISLTFYVEAMQDYIVNESEQNVLPTLGNVKPILDELSPTHDALGNLK